MEDHLIKLIGPNPKIKPTTSFPQARLKEGGGYLERHEDGPELIMTIIEQLPNYLTAVLALIAIWKNRQKQRGEKTHIEISGKGFSHTIEIKSEADEKLAQQLIRHYSEK
ncbi:MAG: hypothetical protein IPL46_19495 [Saprospiraceae bacterium]|nr:hypothetical protein [Saprospiraceae bacterium]